MVFSKFIEKLGLADSENRAFNDAHDILSVALLDGESCEFSDNTLYFGYSSQLNTLVQTPAHCIAAQDSREAPVNSDFDAVAIPVERFFHLFNTALAITRESADLERFYDELIARAAETKSLDAFINTASARLGNSLILMDLNFQILAHSTIYQINDTLWAENVRRGYCNYEFISAVSELDSIKNAPETREAVEVTCVTSPYKKLSSRIYRDGNRIGYLLMLEKDTPIKPEHMGYMQTVSKAAAEAMAMLAPYHLSKSTQYQRLIYDLLIGATAEDVSRRLKSLSFPEKMCALAVSPTRYLSKSHLRENVAELIKRLIPGSHITFYLGGIAALVPVDGPSLNGERLAGLEELCSTEYVRIGISSVFSDAVNFAKYYEQAAKALEIDARLRGEKALCRYQDYAFHDLLDYAGEKTALGRYCHPALSWLNRYDYGNGTDFYRTLRAYLDCGCNSKDTAQRLFIHRNTLSYRMDRILELTGLDLSDSYTRFLLFMSYEIDRHMGQGT